MYTEFTPDGFKNKLLRIKGKISTSVCCAFYDVSVRHHQVTSLAVFKNPQYFSNSVSRRVVLLRESTRELQR